MGGLSLDTTSTTVSSSAPLVSPGGLTSPSSPHRQHYTLDQLHPHGLQAIAETDNDEVSSNTGDEGALGEDSDNEERREIDGDMLREMAIKSGYLLKKGERRKVSCFNRQSGASGHGPHATCDQPAHAS